MKLCGHCGYASTSLTIVVGIAIIALLLGANVA